MNTSKDYGMLRGIATFLRILAWIGLALGIIAAIVLLLLSLPAFMRWVGVFASLAIGIGWFVPMYGFGSVLHLLLDIEKYTRPSSS